jgi:hypothetical protein
MQQVDRLQQLSTFEIIRDILLQNAVLSAKFKKNSFHEFEPSLKDVSVNLPYFVIKIPSTNTDPLVLNRKNNLKMFNITLVIVLDFDARDKLVKYCQAAIAQLESESARIALQDAGYKRPTAELIDTGVDILNEKKCVSAELELTLEGQTERT